MCCAALRYQGCIAPGPVRILIVSIECITEKTQRRHCKESFMMDNTYRANCCLFCHPLFRLCHPLLLPCHPRENGIQDFLFASWIPAFSGNDERKNGNDEQRTEWQLQVWFQSRCGTGCASPGRKTVRLLSVAPCQVAQTVRIFFPGKKFYALNHVLVDVSEHALPVRVSCIREHGGQGIPAREPV